VRSGQLRAIAVGSTHESSLLPGLPTVAASVPGYESSGWFGILVPAKTPRPIIDRLNAGFGVELIGGPPETFGKYLAAQSAGLKTVAQAANQVLQ